MEKMLSFGSRSLIKVGGSLCLPIPSIYIQDMNIAKGAEFDIEMLDDKSVRIIPIYSTFPTDQKIITPDQKIITPDQKITTPELSYEK